MERLPHHDLEAPYQASAEYGSRLADAVEREGAALFANVTVKNAPKMVRDNIADPEDVLSQVVAALGDYRVMQNWNRFGPNYGKEPQIVLDERAMSTCLHRIHSIMETAFKDLIEARAEKRLEDQAND